MSAVYYKPKLDCYSWKKRCQTSYRKLLVFAKYIFTCYSLAMLQRYSVEKGFNSSKLIRTLYFTCY